MASAPTPRVRTLVVCDGVRASKLEHNVFHLRGARSHILARVFPVHRRLVLFLILSSPRPGRFPSYIRVIDDESDRAVFHGQVALLPVFPDTDDLLLLDLPIHVRFPKPGRYTVQVWFFQEASNDVLRMEQPFYVFESED